MEISIHLTPIIAPIVITLISGCIIAIFGWSGANQPDNWGGGVVEATIILASIIVIMTTWVCYGALKILS